MNLLPSRTETARAGLTVLLAFLSAASAPAATLTIDPVRVDLTNDRKIGALRVVNQDQAAVSIRVTALKWEQRDGVDVYTETSDIIASPPVFTIAPGKGQLLRVGLGDNDTGRFRAYRLIVEEIPRLSNDGSAIQIAMNLNLPLYALPKTGKGATLAWRLVRDAENRLVLEASNPGDQPVRVHEIGLSDGRSRPIVASAELGVVLPGSMRRWTLAQEPRASGQPTTIVAKTNFGDQNSQIAARQP